MRRFFSINVVVIFLVLNYSSCQKGMSRPAEEMSIDDRAFLLIDDEQNLRKPLSELIELTGLGQAVTLTDAVTKTQSSWLRPEGTERIHLWEQYTEKLPVMLEHFASLGLVDQVLPRKQAYDYVIILGSMYGDFSRRLLFLEQLVLAGLTCKKLGLLGSHRPLERQHELEPMMRDQAFAKLPLTEIEMMSAIFEKSSLSLKLKGSEIIHIASPMKTLENGSIARANTLDTVEDFLRNNKKPGSVLVISSQPYVLRQHLVVASVLTTPWQVETVGPRAETRIPTTVYLDELARSLFELQKYLGLR